MCLVFLKFVQQLPFLVITTSCHVGEENIVERSVRQLEQHSASEKPTYAYYFTEKHKTTPPASLWTIPDWLKVSADHGDEVAFVFGGSLIKEAAKTDPLWESESLIFNPTPAVGLAFARIYLRDTRKEMT